MTRLLVSRPAVTQQYVCARCRSFTVIAASRRRLFHNSLRRRDHASVLSLLEERGLVNQIAGDRNAFDRLLQTKRIGAYAGIDPTAPSLHLGHLLPLMVLFWLYHHGHYAVSLVGGATARVGDPSGRLTSRAHTADVVHETNFKSMSTQLGNLWNNALKYGKRHGYGSENGKRVLLDNSTWLNQLNILDFLKMMGTGMRLGTMLGRDTVRNKMEKGDGMSFAEFTYPLLQAWDWWQMYQDHGVQVQVGGGDQYGNIIAGMDAVRHIAQSNVSNGQRSAWFDEEGKLKSENTPMGLTVPLLTTSSGEKFGKSAGNALWLDRNLTSAFDLYGFLLRSSDDDVERYLKLFTFVPVSEITSIMVEHRLDPGKRRAQHLLGSEVLELVHGREEAVKTRAEHSTLRSPSLAALAHQKRAGTGGDGAATSERSNGTQRTVLPSSLVLNTPFSRILYHAGLVQSKSEGARLIAKGGAYVALQSTSAAASESSNLGFVQIRDQSPEDVRAFVVDGLLIFRVGKWKVRVIEVIEDVDFEAQNLDAPGWQESKPAR